MELHEETDEILYRCINKNDNFWDNEFERPSSAAFKDKNGLSVDKRCNRLEVDIISSFSKRFKNIRCTAKITVEECLSIKLHPINKPSAKNSFHAEIHDSADEVEISSSKCHLLKTVVKIIS